MKNSAPDHQSVAVSAAYPPVVEARCEAFKDAVAFDRTNSFSLLEEFLWVTHGEKYPPELFTDAPLKDIRFWVEDEAKRIAIMEAFLERALGGRDDEATRPEWRDYLKGLAEARPDWRYSHILLGRHYVRHQAYEDAVAAFRISFSMKSNCLYNETLYGEAVRAWVGAQDPKSFNLSNIERAFFLDLTDKLCIKPFANFEVWNTGDVYICCGQYVPAPIGNVFEQSFQEIWNSPIAQEIRRSMYDGSFKYCSRTCPRFVNEGNLYTREELTDLLKNKNKESSEEYSPSRTLLHDMRYAPHITQFDDIGGAEITKMKCGPSFVNMAHDFTCNLACPSCRNEFRAADQAFRNKLDIARDRVFKDVVPGALELRIAGDGDPFSSKHYRDILASLDAEKTPNLKLYILTNGVLFTPKEWNRFSNIIPLLHNVAVSIDAATPETYSVVRRGGNWNRLMENLQFLAQKHKEGFFKELVIQFVVQERNFREMKAFIDLGLKLGVTSILFQQLHNGLDAFNGIDYKTNNIYDPEHPHFEEFRALLRDPIFKRQDVLVGQP